MDNLLITLYYGGPVERHACSWDDVRAFISIVEPNEGYTAILVTTLEGTEVLGVMIR